MGGVYEKGSEEFRKTLNGNYSYYDHGVDGFWLAYSYTHPLEFSFLFSLFLLDFFIIIIYVCFILLFFCNDDLTFCGLKNQ
jgi:hypothetical protein